MPTPTLPDATVVTRTALLAQTSLATLVGDRIKFAIPNPWPTDANGDLPVLVLSLVDDDELRPETLTARVQVDVWGKGPSTQDVLDCKAIAATVRSVARDLDGDWAAGKIRNCTAGQIIPASDPKTGRSRHIVDLTLELNS